MTGFEIAQIALELHNHQSCEGLKIKIYNNYQEYVRMVRMAHGIAGCSNCATQPTFDINKTAGHKESETEVVRICDHSCIINGGCKCIKCEFCKIYIFDFEKHVCRIKNKLIKNYNEAFVKETAFKKLLDDIIYWINKVDEEYHRGFKEGQAACAPQIKNLEDSIRMLSRL